MILQSSNIFLKAQETAYFTNCKVSPTICF